MKLSKIKLLVGVLGLIALLFLGTAIYTGFIKEAEVPVSEIQPQESPISGVEQAFPSPLPNLGRGEITGTEEVACGNEVYVFDTVFTEEEGYFNNVYKTTRSPENFLVRLKSSRGDRLGAFAVLATPEKDCNRIYLTTIILESDVPAIGIFEWQISEKTVRELIVSKWFISGYVTPTVYAQVVSPDGEKIIVAESSEGQICSLRSLRLLYLREDKSEVLTRLQQGEVFERGIDDVIGSCLGLNFGWQDESTVYYDVFDETKQDPNYYFHPLIERRTLKIE